MSNAWSYNLLIDRGIKFSEKQIQQIIESVAEAGYTAVNPVTGRVHTIIDLSPNGMEMQEYENGALALTDLFAHDGSVQLWKGEVDIGLDFDLEHRQYGSEIDALHMTDTPTYGIVSIFIDGTWFRENRDRVHIAQDLLALFTDLASKLGAVYGYVIDEDVFEAFFRQMHIHNDVRVHRLPSVLSWLNYTTMAISKTESSKLETLGGNIVYLSTGKLISFFNYPWEVTASGMKRINEQWAQM